MTKKEKEDHHSSLKSTTVPKSDISENMIKDIDIVLRIYRRDKEIIEQLAHVVQ